MFDKTSNERLVTIMFCSLVATIAAGGMLLSFQLRKLENQAREQATRDAIRKELDQTFLDIPGTGRVYLQSSVGVKR